MFYNPPPWLFLSLSDIVSRPLSSAFCSLRCAVENCYKTKWAQEPPPYGAFEDYVILETESGALFIMHDAEFNWICENLYNLYDNKRKIGYIQILREWNETKGFDDIDGIPSKINDVSDTIKALSRLEPLTKPSFGELLNDDLEKLILFLRNNESSMIVIKKE
jgi:hypothetical protein